MKKTKAIFAIAVVIIVAGASAGLWYLNEHGYIGGKESSSAADDAVFIADNNDEQDENDNKDDNDDKHKEPESGKDKNDTGADDERTNDKAYTDINEYLSNFSKVYFSEDGKYSKTKYSGYEVLNFAYTHIKRTDPDSLSTVRKNDVIGYYSCVPYESMNAVTEEFLGITIKKESVPTSDEFLFFEYDEGFFYTPAADGVSYNNIIIADKVTEKDGIYKVDFTVYSEGADCDMTSKEAAKSGKKYASGTAEIEICDERYILKTYKLK